MSNLSTYEVSYDTEFRIFSLIFPPLTFLQVTQQLHCHTKGVGRVIEGQPEHRKHGTVVVNDVGNCARSCAGGH